MECRFPSLGIILPFLLPPQSPSALPREGLPRVFQLIYSPPWRAFETIKLSSVCHTQGGKKSSQKRKITQDEQTPDETSPDN